MLSIRRLVIACGGIATALSVAAAPIIASADTGPIIPVRLSPKGGHDLNPTTYLAEVPKAFAIVHRSEAGVTFIVHDSAVTSGQPYLVFVFNTPQNCLPADAPGKHVSDPQGEQAALCDPGIAYDKQHGNLRGPTVGAVDKTDRGNFIVTVPASPTLLTNPKGAEVVLYFPAAGRHILFADPTSHEDWDDD